MAEDKRMSPEELTAYHEKQLELANDKVERGLKNLATPELYKLFLEQLGKLKGFTLNNSILIHEQMPSATKLETYNDWKEKYDLQVNQKSKVRVIKYAPYTKEIDKEVVDPRTNQILRDGEGNAITKKELITIPNFKTEALFDISQTKGDRALIPEQASVGNMGLLIKSIEGTLGEPLAIKPRANKQKVLIEAVQVLTMRQLDKKEELFVRDESGMSHRIPKTDVVKAFEQESVLYATCQHFGIQAGAEQLLTLAKQVDASDVNLFKGVLESVHFTTMSNIRVIDASFKEQTQELSQKKSIMSKLSQNKDKISQPEHRESTPTKSKAMGL